jgi:hypothetical protein
MIHAVRLAAALLATVVLASCGDDSDDEGGSRAREYRPVPRNAEERLLRQLAPGWIVDGERELGQDDVLRGFERRAGPADTVTIEGKDARIVTLHARRLARGVLLD